MTKQQQLDLIKLLSAIEGWSLSTKQPLPDSVLEIMAKAVDLLSVEVLK